MLPDVLIVGAGIAGLSCAGALQRAGARVVVLDKGRGVGGRAATRRVEGQPVDHGLAFYHGYDPGFLAALDRTPATRVEGWPRRVRGAGVACNPAAFDPWRPAPRLAFEEGVSAFPKALAEGLDVRLGARVTALADEGSQVLARIEGAEALRAPTVVLALPVEQSAALLGALPGVPRARALMRLVGTVSCQTAIAIYDGPDDPLAAELYLPEESDILTLIAHDSSKRPRPRRRALVLQAREAWSSAQLEAPGDQVCRALLDEAARLLGPWAASPALCQHHRWRHARALPHLALAAPSLEALPGGARLGLTGESFHPAVGAEGAWLAGEAMARQLSAAAG